ncbi:Helicase associated domain protein [Streptomyces sp. NPDC012461]|uniref:DEAD/DEAH box helicase family protein n=2 Tax=unclassified Streptomyces TaxID=2593676 RepID=A0A6G3R1Q5_9ACTN|nr:MULTISPECIES: DEAD/DEAH box helicase [unclassified Streptomyces]NEA89394.1 DEAD/DEAH box helicase family protein [Streptomyces sp. SID14436]NEC81616.1 DEAD/DEAH box helicase family protein [Streptomyces sp. SID7958]
MASDIELRPHQKDAVAAATRTLGQRSRASVIAACGTGKTLIAARTTARIAPRGRVLVLLPTLDLLSQTIRSWRTAGRKGTTIAVCSARQALDHEPLGADVPLTTDSGELTALATPPRSGPVTAYATYASLSAVIAAHRDHRLPAWDLVVVDEAHRTAGRLGKAWAAVHHDDQVPAARRLYLSATPRIWDPDDASDTDGTEAVASMDDENLFGPVAYHLNLSDAIDLGLLADYQILVPVVTDQDLRDWLATGPGAGVDGLRLAGRQVAALRAIHDHRLRRILTFHHRVADARAFATTLADTAATLPAELRPEGLWADWISGSHAPQVRRRLLLEFASHTTPDTPAVLSNARVLGEGIDVPAIDAVVFADPKNSPVDTVQAVGRALRQRPGAGKKATLVVPVYLTPDEDPDDLLGADAYTPLWRTIQALRAHDDRLDARLSDPRTHRPTMPGEDPEAWLRFDRPTQAEEVALALSLRVLAPKSAEWRRGLAAARRFRHSHHHLDVPQAYEDPTGYPLGRWLTWQRHLHTKGTLDTVRVHALERLGIIWDPRQQAFERALAHAAAYAARHGHLAAPVEEVHDGFPLGRWLATQRTRAETLTEQRAAALTALDRWWNPPWPITWQRTYHAARQSLEHNGTASQAEKWLEAQRARSDRLHPEQKCLLKELGLVDLPGTSAFPAGESHLPARERAFQRGLAAARAFRAREGHLNVPQRHIEEIDGDPVRLGQWLSNLRRRRFSLSPHRQAALAELGL